MLRHRGAAGPGDGEVASSSIVQAAAPGVKIRVGILSSSLAMFLGGAGAVAAEVVFARRMSLLFGITAPATAMVVAVYMAGMALGASYGGRLADRLGPRSGWLYVGAELFALVWAALFPLLFHLADDGLSGVSAAGSLGACALASVLLVAPAAIASGATFPSVSRLIGREASVRTLYAANAIGAALGGLAAGLVLPSVIGFAGTLLAAGGASAAAGLLMLPAARRGAPEQYTPVAEPQSTAPLSVVALGYAAVATAGMSAELGWTRLLEHWAPNPGSVCFPLVLGAYLMGLTAGGLWLEPLIRRMGERRAMTFCTLLAGLSTTGAVGVLPLLPTFPVRGEQAISLALFRATGLDILALRCGAYLLAAAIPGMAAGAAYPIAASALARARAGLGRGVGLASMTGILAGVVASLWMGLMPAWGPGTVRSLALIGTGVLVVATIIAPRRWWVIPIALVGAATVRMPPTAAMQMQPGQSLTAFIETAAGPSGVTLKPRVLVHTHGEWLPGAKLDLSAPLLLHPQPTRAMVIALGTGVNVRTLVDIPSFKRIVCVDVDSALPRLTRYVLGPDVQLFDGVRSIFVGDDGRHHLRRSPETYDFILSDVATYAQYVGLGTLEFFQLVRSRLAPGGIFALKLHLDRLSDRGAQRFIATFLEVFPDSALFGQHMSTPMMVGFTARPSWETALTREKALAGQLRPQAASRMVWTLRLGPSGLAGWANGPLMTDNRPIALRSILAAPHEADPPETTANGGFRRVLEQWGADAVQEILGEKAAAIAASYVDVPVQEQFGSVTP